MAISPIIYGDFSRGLVDSVAPDNMDPSELVQADNIDLSERGGFKKRMGTVNLNTASYGAEVSQVFEWHKNDGTIIHLAMIGRDLCSIDDDGERTTIIGGLNSNQIGYCFYVSSGEKMFFVDGLKYYQWDGTVAPVEVTPNADATNDLEPIKRCKYLLFHPKSFRIFAAGDSTDPGALYYSEYGDPTFFAETSKLYPISGEGPITGISTFMGAMLSFYQRGIYMWTGVDPDTDAEWGKIPVPDGTSSPYSIVNTPVSLTFLGQDGLISIQPGVLDENVVLVANNSYVLNLTEKRIDGLISEIKHPETACAIYYKGRYHLAYGDDESNSKNNKILLLDWKLGSFTKYTGLQVNSFCHRRNGDLVFGMNGYVRKMGVGYSDAGAVISMEVKTVGYGLDAPFNIKKVKTILISAKQYGTEASNVHMDIKADRQEKEYDIKLDETMVWGDIWREKVWGWDDLITKQGKVNLKGKRFQLTFTNSDIGQPCTIYGIGFIAKLKKAKGVKKGVTVTSNI